MSHRVFRFLVVLLVSLLVGCGGGDDGEDDIPFPSVVDVPLVDEGHVCTDEADRAFALTAHLGLGEDIPTLWNGEPFVVDITSIFRNADELLEIVADEADKIADFLGYYVIVPGEVRRLPDVPSSLPLTVSTASQYLPPDGRIHVLCCRLSEYGDADGYLGFARPEWRFVVMHGNDRSARLALIHELYHVLGFHHPGEQTGVPMSATLDGFNDLVGYEEFLRRLTESTVEDLERLACVYD